MKHPFHAHTKPWFEAIFTFPSFDPGRFTHWVDGHVAPDEPPPAQLAEERRRQLNSWKIDADHLAQFRSQTELRVLAERRLEQGQSAELGSLLDEVRPGWQATAAAPGSCHAGLGLN